MRMKIVIKTVSALFMAASVLMCVPSCKTSKEPQKENIEVSVFWTKYVTYTSQGTIQIPVLISDVTGVPDFKDFRLVKTMESSSSMTYRWDMGNSTASEQPSESSAKVEVTGVERVEDTTVDWYYITLSYDFSGIMRGSVEYELWYGDNKADVPFDIENYSMSHNTIGVDNTTFGKDPSRLDDLFIPLDAAFAELGVSTADFADTQLYEFYCAKNAYKPNISKPGSWEDNDDAFVVYGSEGNENGIFIMLDESLEAGSYVVQLIIAKGHKQYVGISVPFTIAESNFL